MDPDGSTKNVSLNPTEKIFQPVRLGCEEEELISRGGDGSSFFSGKGVSMAKEMFVSSSLHETRVAVLDNGALVEVYFQREQDVGLVGGIYMGRVNRVLPGMQSAFVEIGLERDAFLYVSDFYEESDEYEKMDTDLEQKGKRPVIDLSE